MCWYGCGSTRQDTSIGATCATHRGSSGHCWKRRSRATSSPTSRSATSHSTARTQGTTYDTAIERGGGGAHAPRGTMLRTLLQGLRSPVTEPVPHNPDIAALAANLDRAAQRRLGRSLA